jgi:putative toxin-antitoxin system antitoxin component (TIGR02293 family)
MIRQLGSDIFGTNEKFAEWLDARNVALNHRKPIELLNSSFGINLVRDALVRIEHGVLS